VDGVSLPARARWARRSGSLGRRTVSGKHTEPREPGRRWWEIRGKGQPDEGSYRELLTDRRGRNRQERSLSAGADPSDEPRHPLRGFLWPVASVVAAALLIVVVVYGVSASKSRPPTLTERAAGSSANRDAGIPPSLPSALVGDPPPPEGGALPPVGGLAAVPSAQAPAPPRAPASPGVPAPQGSPATTPSAPVTTLSAPTTTRGSQGPGSDDATTTANDPTTTTPSDPTTTLSSPTSASTAPTSTLASSTLTTSPASAITLAGPAPAAPRSQQDGTPVSGTGGCAVMGTSTYYACTIAQTAPAYLPGTTHPRASLPPNRYPFMCQSDGSTYSVGQRANHWWAWAGNGSLGVWTPAVFLAGGPDDAPEPGLPVCGSASTTTTSPAAPFPDRATTTTTPPVATSTEKAPTTTTPRTTDSETKTTTTSPPSGRHHR
jgi:hypothetical protein